MRRILALALALGATACGETAPPLRDCLARVWVDDYAGDVRVIGSWDGWALPGEAPEGFEPGWRLLRLELPPGDHGYLLFDGVEARRDPHNPLGTYSSREHGETEVSLLAVGDCNEPRLRIDGAAAIDGELRVEATFLARAEDQALAGVTASAPLAALEADGATGRVVVAGAPSQRKHRVTIEAADAGGAVARADVSLWAEPRDRRDEVIYQIMTDRFRGDGGVALAPPVHAGARAGGTLGGVEASLEDIAEVATTLWLSPVYRNPDEERLGKDGRLYTGYHGYWPLATRELDARIGGEAAFDALIAAAHDRELLVLADVVPNHVYEGHPRFADHGAEGWFSPPGCVCGTPECPWHEHIESCWFAPYLPDVRWQDAGAFAAAVDDVAWLVERFDLDGVRVDAVPMMPRAASRRIAARLRAEVQPADALWLLGEVFTGPGAGGVEQLGRHLGAAGMNSVFDFPLMWAMHDVLGRGADGFERIEQLLALEERELAGSGAVLARILDNHDTPRFVSVAEGDAWGNPWLAPAAQPASDEPYRRLQLALALIFTLPGAPVLYQGDEIGLAGGNDPDNRRVMPADAELSPAQRAVRETTVALARLRRCSTALRRGERVALDVGDDVYAFARVAGAETVIVALSRSSEPRLAETGFQGELVDAQTGRSSGPDIDLAPLSFRILVSGSTCRL